MENIQGLDLALANLGNWLWYDVIAHCWWIATSLIVVAIIMVLLLWGSGWAQKKQQTSWDQIKRDIDYQQSNDHKVPPSSSL